jgi:hypothetical protein
MPPLDLHLIGFYFPIQHDFKDKIALQDGKAAH